MTTSSPSSWQQQFSRPPPIFVPKSAAANHMHGLAKAFPGGGGGGGGGGVSLFRPMPHVPMTTPPPTPTFVPRFIMSVPPPMIPSSSKVRQKMFSFCVFCKNNGEDESYFLSHTLKDDSGKVVCPILSAYVCPICTATGPVAHTVKYCPQNRDGELNNELNNEHASIMDLKRMRSSIGKPPRAILGGQLGFPSSSSAPTFLKNMTPVQMSMMQAASQTKLLQQRQQRTQQQDVLAFMRGAFYERGGEMHFDNSRGSSGSGCSMGNSPADTPPTTPMHDAAVSKTSEGWKTQVGKFFGNDF